MRSLRVFPAERILAPGSFEQQLVVTAELDDGTTRDVTRQAAYDVSRPHSRGGVVGRAGQGRARLRNRRERSLHERARDGPARRSWPIGPVSSGAACRRTGRSTSWSSPSSKPCGSIPRAVCGDSVFLRRAFLDSIGRLPEPGEARSFLDDTRPAKTREAGGPPGRAARVCGFLGSQVGRPAAQRRKDDG